ncbi:hypothetical protein ACE2AJ_16485 [Aquihabitans daechungensis]|uniref:hypothetical protein n=1 Tax=Aquihabitans daechungensis TaxID=1052257 RepID=UPI003BA34C34
MDERAEGGPSTPNLDHLAGGRVIAPTGLMRWVVIVLLALFIAAVMIAMAWLTIS